MWDPSELRGRPRGAWPLAAPVPARGHLGWSGDTGLLGLVVEGMGRGGHGCVVTIAIVCQSWLESEACPGQGPSTSP